ncbi:MAG: MFS transporter, partial [Pseudomonadota bacterium]|nr:MFS transporter [Pseudomonadota bacterium]
MIEAKTRAWWRATAALCLGSCLVCINQYVPQPVMPGRQEAY